MRNLLIFCSTIILAQKNVSPLFSSFDQYQKAKEQTLFNLDWISVGPVMNSDRVEAVLGDPKNAGTL